MKDFRNIPLNNNTNNVIELQIQDDLDKNNHTRKWFRYLQVLNQMIGLINVKGNEDFENRQNTLFEAIYTQGRAGISFIGGRLQIWSISGYIKYDINGDLDYVDVLPYTGIGDNIQPDKLKTVRLKSDKVVVIKSGSFGYSLWFLWNQILTDSVDLMNIYLTNARLNIKKLQWIVNNGAEEITNEELASILDPTSPVIKTINPVIKAGNGDIRSISGEQNVIAPLELSDNNYSIEDVVNHWIFETNLMGLYQDEYHKKERQTSGENEVSAANTILIHEVYLREFKRAEKEIKDKFKITVTFDKTVELAVEDNKDKKESEEDE